jgi:hypothetical protein
MIIIGAEKFFICLRKLLYVREKIFCMSEKFLGAPPLPRLFWKNNNWRLKSGETVKTCILVKFSTQFLTECRVCEKLYNGMYRMVTLQRHVYQRFTK